MEPRRIKTWVTTIFETDDDPATADDVEPEPPIIERSNALLIGELNGCCNRDGENVWLREPPPPLLLPTPACDAVDGDAAEDGKCEAEEGVMVRDLGDKIDGLAWGC